MTGLRAGEDAFLRWLDRPLIGGGSHGRMLRGWFKGEQALFNTQRLIYYLISKIIAVDLDFGLEY
jgi:hypothetical protein